MINELYSLFRAMEQSGISAQNWHRKYKLIPNVRRDAPCVRILISDGRVECISAIGSEQSKVLRKYGSNQGSYPCMNLAPLYRVTDDQIKKQFAKLRPEDLTYDMLRQIEELCSENNWGDKFRSKYKISMENMPSELSKLSLQFQPLQTLIDETKLFENPEHLHEELRAVVFDMLQKKEKVSLAMAVLFYFGKSDKNPRDDYGSLSVAFDSRSLIETGISSISTAFVEGFNEALLKEDLQEASTDSNVLDAFGVPFQPIEEPMPEVKLAGGFDVKLRTLFKEQRCQTRYARIENASYPISPQMRKSLQAALNWLGSEEHKKITWINTDKNEILFAYPSKLPETPISCVKMFKQPANRDKTFKRLSKEFLSELRKSKKVETDSHADRIQLFILRKIDKARTKVIYTRQTDPYELERFSEEWTVGCLDNLPDFPFVQPEVPFPLNVADILNRFWNQKGESITDKFKPVPQYHGMELLMEPDLPVTADLHNLTQKAMLIGAFLGSKLANHELNLPIWDKIKDMLGLMGLLLYRNGIRKEIYMENLPYLYGQLLKVSDELHALYCTVARRGDYPSQFAGVSLFQAAAEDPVRTLNTLSQRIAPYYAWAKSYRLQGVQEKNKESWRASWLYSLYEAIAVKLHDNWTLQRRFSDEEKAQLFIGYLAAFPKKEIAKELSTEEDPNNE